MRALLSRACEDARRHGLLATNPARGLTSLTVRETEDRKIKFWDDAQTRHFLAASADHRDAMLWRILLASGLRIGEALALRWQDVDLTTGVLTVRRTLSRKRNGYDVKPPKTRSGLRAIPLDAATAEALRAHRQAVLTLRIAHADVWADRDLVFPNDAGAFCDPRTLRRRFTALCKQLTMQYIGVHGLRHTHATMLLASGIPAKVVSERLGHSSIAITLDTYSHVTAELQQAAARAIGAVLG
jgi:integrase